MLSKLFRFCRDENGAVTVDWVVLTGAIVGIGMLVLTPIAYSTDNTATVVSELIENQEVGYPSTP
jgi:Flp pilus assembly pilin Flp